MDLSWASWRIWQVSHLVTEMQDCVEGCLKRWDQSWRIMARGSHLDLEMRSQVDCRWNCDRRFSKQNCSEVTADLESDNTVRHGLHWGGSLQNGLRDEWTCGMTLASVYVLYCLSAVWSQLQIKKRKSEWEWVLIGVLPLNTGDRVQWKFISINYQTSKLQCNY